MAHINGIVTSKNSVAVTERVKAMVAAGVEMKYRGFAEAPKAKARTFQENLVLINPLLPEVLAWILLGFYSERFPTRDVKPSCRNSLQPIRCKFRVPKCGTST